jgi:small-conductance mechanosensitive channel
VTWLIERVEPGEGKQKMTVRARVSPNVSKGDLVGNAVTVDTDQTPPTTQRAIANISAFTLPFIDSPAVRDGALVGGVLVASYAIGWGAAAGVTKLWLIPKGAELSTQLLLGRVTKYGIVILGGLFALAQTNINPEPVLLGAGVGGIAFAFGAKEIIANYVCGLIIMVDRPLKVGDIVEVEGAVGEVLDVGLRATTIRTANNLNHLVPNTVIVLHRITNFSKYDPNIRLQIPVRVAYGSDMEKVKEVIQAAMKANPKILEEPAPEVRIIQFGESSIDLIIFAWIGDPKGRFRIGDEINWELSQKFRENNIKIPFDQRDLWLREE